MYPVKTTVDGMPLINYPDVCVNEPENQTAAFCEEHSHLAVENNIPTKLTEFVQDYCKIKKLEDEEDTRPCRSREGAQVVHNPS